jgi:RNA polymerase sigma-70 factor, ECF subfamily
MTEHLAALIERIALRDTDAMLRFYDRTASRVFGFLGTRIGDPEAREDVMERIYLEVWRTADSFEAQRYSPGAWLIALADTITAELHASRAQPAA